MFPDLFRGLEAAPKDKEYDLAQLFLNEDGSVAVPDPAARLDEVRSWLGQLPTLALPLCPCDSTSMDTATIRSIEQATAQLRGPTHIITVANLTPAVLIRPITIPMMRPSPPEWQLGHRVVNLRSEGSVPFGLRGTVVAMYNGRAEVVFDSQFLAGDSLGGKLTSFCGAVVPLWTLLNLSLSEFKVAKADTVQRGNKQSDAGASGSNAKAKKKGGGGGGGGGGRNMFDLLMDASA